MENPDFWSKFWPVFASSMISGIIFTVLIGAILSYVRRPKIKIALSITTSIKGHRLNFFAINNGKVGLMPNELKWNVYFPFRIQPQKQFVRPVGVMSGSQTIGFDSYNNFSGFNEKPILPGDSLHLIHILVDVKDYKIKNESIPDDIAEQITKSYGDFELIDEANYYYSITTSRGQKKYENFFWGFLKKKQTVSDWDFVERPIFKIKDIEI